MSFTYLRLLVTNSGGDSTAVAELKFYDGGGIQIATTGGTPSSSSNFGGQPASFAFDANSATFWNSNVGPTVASPQWVRYQFGVGVTPATFTIQTRNDSFFFQGPTGFSLEGSNNGTTWTTLGTYGSAGFTSAGQTQTYTVGNGLSDAYLLLITNSGVNTCTIAEWKLYDSSAVALDTLTGAATASSVLNRGNFDGVFAFDNDPSTFWNSSATPSGVSPEWLAYRFNSTPNVPAFFTIQARSGASFDQAPQAFSLQSSPDGVTWTTLASYTAVWTFSNQIQRFPPVGHCWGCLID